MPIQANFNERCRGILYNILSFTGKVSILFMKNNCNNMMLQGEVMNTMPISELIDKVSMICKRNGVKRLDLFGSFATGTATPTSDIDCVVYGCDNLQQLEDDLLEIETLRKIDIFDYDNINNDYLLEDIKKYGKQIY